MSFSPKPTKATAISRICPSAVGKQSTGKQQQMHHHVQNSPSKAFAFKVQTPQKPQSQQYSPTVGIDGNNPNSFSLLAFATGQLFLLLPSPTDTHSIEPISPMAPPLRQINGFEALFCLHTSAVPDLLHTTVAFFLFFFRFSSIPRSSKTVDVFLILVGLSPTSGPATNQLLTLDVWMDGGPMANG